MNRNTDYIPFARPSLDGREEEAVLRVLRSGWLTTGKEALAFEEEFASYVGVPYAAGVNSATAGLHLALAGLEIPPESRVITTPYTFTATGEVIRYLGAHPLFVDVREDFNMDTRRVRQILESPERKNVSAILPVHVAGRSCGGEELPALSREYRIPLVEDAAHAFPAKSPGAGGSGGAFLGTAGDAGVFSFYATKTMTTGEGGMVVSRDENLIKKIRCLRLHGIDRDIWNRYQGRNASWEYDVLAPGYKYNLTDLAAALGRVQLQKAQGFFEERKKIARFYSRRLGEIPGLILPADSDQHSWHLYIIRLDREQSPVSRDAFIEEMARRGIGCSVHYKPLHLMTYYKNKYKLKPEDFPNAHRLFQEAVSLPIYPGLTEDQLDRITETIRGILGVQTQKQAGGGF